jgi:hypothetical protein
MQEGTLGVQGELVNMQMTAVYAPADFPDADVIDNKHQVNLTNSISNMILYHMSDTVEKHQQSRLWKRKVREIIQNHQEQILQFFTKPIPNEHPLRAARILLAKYGKAYHQESYKNPPSFLKDYIVDISSKGIDSLNEYIDTLMKSRGKDSPIIRWTAMTRQMLDYMRDVGDELIRIDQKLKNECSHLDTIVDKVKSIIELPNPEIEGFENMMEKYIEKQFMNHPIQAVYWDYIYTLQKYSALRDILIPQRLVNISEPICCICMTEPIVMAMIPCGHTFCTNCSKRTTVCHLCRQVVTNRIRIFFG